jgi:hypothetical protein
MPLAAVRAICASRGLVTAAQPRSTTQILFGADDLDIAPARDGEAMIGRVWAAAGTPIGAEFAAQLARWPARATIVVELTDPAGASLTSARVTSSGPIELQATGQPDRMAQI